MALNPRQRLFVSEYLVDFNGTQAAIRAGYPPSSAGEMAYRALMNEEINAAVQDKLQERLELADLNADWVLRQWKRIAEADPNELTWVEIECCRYCYGTNHAYQWTEPEFREAVYIASHHVCSLNCKFPCRNSVQPDASGGMGYDPRRRPLHDCPVCAGAGYARVRIADARTVSPAARRLFAGVKQTRDGIEIKFRDQDAALQSIAKYYGMVLERRQLEGPGGGPVKITAETTPGDLTTEQLRQWILQEHQRRQLEGKTIEGETVVS